MTAYQKSDRDGNDDTTSGMTTLRWPNPVRQAAWDANPQWDSSSDHTDMRARVFATRSISLLFSVGTCEFPSVEHRDVQEFRKSRRLRPTRETF